MKKFEILEHKADFKIRVFGKDRKKLFLNALLGISAGMKAEILKPEKKVKRKIEIKSGDSPALLVDFLSEVLYLSQLKKEVFSDIIFKELTDKELAGELIGQKAVRFNEDIKAVTYHELDVRQEKNGTWQATILFDI